MQKYWKGKVITAMTGENVFVFGSNPEGRHGMGAAKAAMKFGAVYGKGRGLAGNSYALPTKNLLAGFYEKCSGITYHTAGKCSISLSMIRDNVSELYDCAVLNPNKSFFIVYQKSSNNLNGYDAEDIIKVFRSFTKIPNNIIFHNSFR